jgi:hypothetical protein
VLAFGDRRALVKLNAYGLAEAEDLKRKVS